VTHRAAIILGHQREARSASPNNCPNVGRWSQLIRRIKLKTAKGRQAARGGGEVVPRPPNALRSPPFGFSEGRTQLYGFESVLCARRGFQRSRSSRRSRWREQRRRRRRKRAAETAIYDTLESESSPSAGGRTQIPSRFALRDVATCAPLPASAITF